MPAYLTLFIATKQVAELGRRILYATQLEGWQLGKSRVFLRAGQLAQLEVRHNTCTPACLPALPTSLPA